MSEEMEYKLNKRKSVEKLIRKMYISCSKTGLLKAKMWGEIKDYLKITDDEMAYIGPLESVSESFEHCHSQPSLELIELVLDKYRKGQIEE